MKARLPVCLLAAVAFPLPALAAAQWCAPQPQPCALGPGDECNVEVTCPADRPYVVAGGGGMPEASRPDHGVAMTMNLPVSENTWRGRWKNMHGGEPVEVTVAVRVKCSDSREEAGW